MRVKCEICNKQQLAKGSPLADGWPTCCGYTMTLLDTSKLISQLNNGVPVVSRRD